MQFTDKTKEILAHLVLGVILIAILFSATQLVGLGGSGFDTTETLQQYFFYSAPGIAFIVGILILFIIELYLPKGDSQYGNSVGFASPSSPPSLRLKYLQSWTQIILFSLIIALALGLFATTTHTAFTGVGVLKQQFSFGGSLLFSSLLVPASENLGSAFLFALGLFFLRVYCRKNNVGTKGFIYGGIILAVLIFSIYGITNHVMRYGDSDISITRSVLPFWLLGGVLTAVTGSFIPFWVMHISNNLFFGLQSHFSSDMVLIVTGIVELVLIFLFIYFANKKGKEF